MIVVAKLVPVPKSVTRAMNQWKPKEPTALDRFTYGFSPWVSRTKLPDLFIQVANAIQRVKKE